MCEPPRLVVGIDWATQEHQVCGMDPEGKIVGERVFSHSGDGLADLVAWLERHSDGQLDTVHVAIEIPHGAVVETLLERGCQVFAINPKQLDRFRDRFSLSGAKDDRRDARVLGDSLRTDSHCFRRLHVEEPVVIELREWSRMDEELKHEKVRQGNRLREQLRRYFPQCLELTKAVSAAWFLDLLKQIPTPAHAQKASESMVAAILKRHRIRRITASEALERLRSRAVSVSPGTVEAASAHVGLVVEHLELINEQIRGCERKLEALLEQLCAKSEDSPSDQKGQRDVEILLSFPGIGRIVAAALQSEAAQLLRDRDYHSLRALSGVAPVTRSSGKSRRVVRRYACHPRLRNACYHWARVASQHDPASGALYQRLRQRGKSHGRALRGVGDRLLRVACSMLRHQSFYDPGRQTQAVA